MRLGKFIKTPAEVKRYSINYENWLDTGEYVSAITFATISTSAGLLNFIANNIGATATTVNFFVSGGTNGETYEIAVTMTTSANQVKQDTILYTVKAL